MGFKGHIVFPTSAFDQVIAAKSDAVVMGGINALNRGMAAFCSGDSRMHGAAYIPFQFGAEVALEYLQEAIKNDFSVILIDTCLLYTSPSPRDRQKSRMPSSA